MRKTNLHYAAPLLVVLALLMVGVFLVVSTRQATATMSPQTSSSANESSVPATIGSTIGFTKVTPDGLSITLERIDKPSSRWFFHFILHNLNSNNDATVIGSSDVHQFVITGKTGPTTIVDKVLSTPLASEAAAGYNPLSVTLKSGGASDGWLAIDTASLGFTPNQVLYRYQAYPTKACTNPQDQSTCHIETLYGALIWNL